jgi:Icc-related predicted phosphoesterase
VLVLHCPPYGMNDLTKSGHRGGSLAIKKVVEENRPVLVLAGHIHEARGIVRQDGTLFVNPGAAKDGFSALLDIDDEISVKLLDEVVD